MTEIHGENRAPNPQEQTAEDIYTYLQQQRGRASLQGFNVGDVDYPDNTGGPGFIRIDFIEPTEKYESGIFTSRGFNDDEIAGGFIVIHEMDYLGAPDNRYLNVSRLTGKAVAVGEEGPFRPDLNERDIDAIRTITQLSAIPRRIVEVFGSYRAFMKVLGDRDMSGISSGHDRIYNDGLTGGLEAFVGALRKQSKGTLHTMDSSQNELRRSLMKEDQMVWLRKLVEKFFGNEG